MVTLRKLLVPSVKGLLYQYHGLRLSRLGVTSGERLTVHGPVFASVFPGSSIRLGARVVLNANMGKNTLEARGPVVLRTFRTNAELLIGNDSGMTSCTISAGRSIKIGERVLVGGGVLITDSDHHVVDLSERRRFAGLPSISSDRPVVIGDDVFIGARSIILKGVTIGKGTVIGAGSVVSQSIPAGVVAAGNPCRVLRELHPAE